MHMRRVGAAYHPHDPMFPVSARKRGRWGGGGAAGRSKGAGARRGGGGGDRLKKPSKGLGVEARTERMTG